MIKSPCRNCEKHKQEFPKCFDNCNTIKEFQDLNFVRKAAVATRSDYICSDTCNINIISHQRKGLS